MHKYKSLTLLTLVITLTACANNKSATFSLSSPSSSLSSSEPISAYSSIDESSSNPKEDGTYYDDYYKDLVSWQNGEDLKEQLNSIIRNGYKPLSYTKSSKQNYDTNIHADHSKYDFEYLDVIYSNKDSFKSDTNKGWQREHAWCASLMCGSTTGNAINYKGRATDFHNLFAANASGNQSRGNKNYGYANAIALSYETKYMINNGRDGYSYDEFIFEPGDIDKGRLARAIFYMATMYKDDEVDTANNINMKGLTIVENPVSYVAGNNCAFAIGNLSDLLEWNKLYAVDYLEMQHNIAVYTDTDNLEGYAQGNRNPYIDYPGLVDYVYGNKKDQPGSLKEVIASASYLKCNNNDLSHYAIKEAKREYGHGDILSNDDIKLVEVKNNYSYIETTSLFTNSLAGHAFNEDDGDSIIAQIDTPLNQISYQIILNPMGMCNSGILPLTTAGIDKKKADINQNVIYGEVPFTFYFETSYTSVSSNGMRIDNISAGGVTIGSDPKPLTKLKITTKEEVSIDSAYIKAQAGNATSSYSLTIKVGDILIYEGTVKDSSKWQVFGDKTNSPITGQVSYIFVGTSSLKINSIAFNTIIA